MKEKKMWEKKMLEQMRRGRKAARASERNESKNEMCTIEEIRDGAQQGVTGFYWQLTLVSCFRGMEGPSNIQLEFRIDLLYRHSRCLPRRL